MSTSPHASPNTFPRDATPLIWEGRPHRGWFLRPVDIPNILTITIASMFVVYHRFWLELDPILSILLIFLITYLLIGRFLHDAAIRNQILYQCDQKELRIISIPRKAVLRTIPIQQLIDVTPAWAGYTASITLPQRPRDTFAALTNSWEQLVPAASPTRRLELIDDASEVAALLRCNARAALKKRKDA